MCLFTPVFMHLIFCLSWLALHNRGCTRLVNVKTMTRKTMCINIQLKRKTFSNSNTMQNFKKSTKHNHETQIKKNDKNILSWHRNLHMVGYKTVGRIFRFSLKCRLFFPVFLLALSLSITFHVYTTSKCG